MWTEAANKSVIQHCTEEISDLLDCLELTYHHHLKNMVGFYNNSHQYIMCEQQKLVNALESASNNLNARDDKVQFLKTHAPRILDNDPFQKEFSSEFRTAPEV